MAIGLIGWLLFLGLLLWGIGCVAISLVMAVLMLRDHEHEDVLPLFSYLIGLSAIGWAGAALIGRYWLALTLLQWGLLHLVLALGAGLGVVWLVGFVAIFVAIRIAEYEPLTIKLDGIRKIRGEYQDCSVDAQLARRVRRRRGTVRVRLSNCIAPDLAILSGLPELQCLTLRNIRTNQLTLGDLLGRRPDTPYDLSRIAALKTLRELHLDQCGVVTDVSPLRYLEHLEVLDLTRCHNITSIAAVRELAKLQTLDLSHCSGVQDVSPVAQLTQLTVLRLRASGIRDLAPLELLRNIEELSLPPPRSEGAMQTQICDAARRHPRLRKVFFRCGLEPSRGPVKRWETDLSPLTALTGLEELSLEYCHPQTSLLPLLALPKLRVLSISSMIICHLEIIAKLPYLDLKPAKSDGHFAPGA